MKMQVDIGRHRVGDNLPPYVIAEMSGNHNQSMDGALAIVDRAANSGAHAIKLQTYTPETLTLDSHKPEFFVPEGDSPWGGMRLWDLYALAYTPWEWHAPIFERARALGMDCISTAFDRSSVDFLVECGVDAIKISSFELINLPLIDLAARSNLPLIFSTGMGTPDEIREAVETAQAAENDKLVLLKCTSAYPSKVGDANVVTIPDLRQRYGTLAGLSDHTLSNATVAAAVAIGGCVIEKHLTISRAEGGPDAPFSLEPEEFAAMVSTAREAFEALGAVTYGRLAAEEASAWERPSIFSTRRIRSGEKLTDDNIRVIRPGGGAPPKFLPLLLGSRARVDIEAATAISLDLVDVPRQG